MADRAYLERLTRELASKGRLVEAGWVTYRLLVIHPDAPAGQLDECRLAFMAGAQHLFASIMSMLDPGAEPTDADVNKLDLIHAELEKFRKEIELGLTKPHGSA